MFLVILAILLALVGIGLLIFGKATDDYPSLRKWSVIPFVFAFLFVLFGSVRTVDPGQVAIPVAFGQTSAPLGSGMHFVAPWTDLNGLSVRTDEYTMTSAQGEGQVNGNDSVEVKGADGATGHVDATVLYHLNEADASRVYNELGVSYQDKLVRPTIRTCIRDAYAAVPMIQAVTDKREEIESSTFSCIEKGVNHRGFTLESVQLRKVSLEQQVQKAIDDKVAAQQAAQQKTFELQAATQDAEKKRIESLATADGQQIIKCGGHPETVDGVTKIVPNVTEKCENKLTPEFLEWFYIDMLKSMVGSPNHDTIIIPSKPDGTQDQNLQIQVPANK